MYSTMIMYNVHIRLLKFVVVFRHSTLHYTTTTTTTTLQHWQSGGHQIAKLADFCEKNSLNAVLGDFIWFLR